MPTHPLPANLSPSPLPTLSTCTGPAWTRSGLPTTSAPAPRLPASAPAHRSQSEFQITYLTLTLVQSSLQSFQFSAVAWDKSQALCGACGRSSSPSPPSRLLPLCSHLQHHLWFPRWTMPFHGHAFAHIAPCAWNALSLSLLSGDPASSFKTQLLCHLL